MDQSLSNQAELKERIRALEDSARVYEHYLSTELRKILITAADPAALIKDLAQDFAKDKDFRKDLIKIGLSAGTTYLGKLIQSPATSDALLSFFLKKMDKQAENGGNGLWKTVAKFLSKINSAKQENT